MKKSIFTLCLMAMTIAANAQTSKNVVFNCVPNKMVYTQPVEKKQSTTSKIAGIAGTVLSALAGQANVTTDHPEYADNVMQAITAGVGSTYRFNTVDNAIGKTNVLNINANISAITTTSRTHVWTDSDKKSHSEQEYSANITGTVSLTDPKTGKLVWQTNINCSGMSYGWLTSESSALGNAASYVQSSITEQLDSEFPLYASIVEKGTTKKDKQKEVYIDLGEQAGVCKGMSFYVYQVMTVAGKEAKKEIGRIKIKEVMGDDISNCKVTKGAADLKEAIDGGKTLQIMSRS